MPRYGNDYTGREMWGRGSMRGYDQDMMGDRFMGGGSRGPRDWNAGGWNAGGWSSREGRGMGRGWQGQGWTGGNRGGSLDWSSGYDAGYRGMNRGGYGYGGGMDRDRVRFSAGRGDMDRVHFSDRDDRDLGDRMRSGWNDLKRNARGMFGGGRGGYDRGW